MNRRDRDGRLMRLAVTPQEFMAIVQEWRTCTHFTRIVGDKLPDDVEILDVWYEAKDRSFYLTMHSAAFPVKLEGDLIPVFGSPCRKEDVTVRAVEEMKAKSVVAEWKPGLDITPEQWAAGWKSGRLDAADSPSVVVANPPT